MLHYIICAYAFKGILKSRLPDNMVECRHKLCFFVHVLVVVFTACISCSSTACFRCLAPGSSKCKVLVSRPIRVASTREIAGSTRGDSCFEGNDFDPCKGKPPECLSFLQRTPGFLKADFLSWHKCAALLTYVLPCVS